MDAEHYQREEFEGGRRVLRPQLLTSLTKIAFGTILLGLAFAVTALHRTATSNGRPEGGPHVAVTVAIVAGVSCLLLMAIAWLRYRRRLYRPSGQPLGRSRPRDRDKVVGEPEKLIDRPAEGQALGSEPAVGERTPDEGLPANDPYEVVRNADVRRQTTEASRDGVRRSSAPRRGPIR